MTVTFKVSSDIQPSSKRFPLDSVEQLLEAKGISNLETCKIGAASVVLAPPMHGLLLATHLAFSHHLPLEISPDDVWSCIAQGFSLHIAASSGALDGRLARSETPVELFVVRDEFVLGGENDWSGVVAEFCEKMRPQILLHGEFLSRGFSTTGPVEQAVHQITQMAAMEKFFLYVLLTRCGIPEITLLGTRADWEDIRHRASLLREFDLAWWIDPLLPALDEFVRASSGKADAEWWRSFYKHRSISGNELVSGHFLLLVPYLKSDHGQFNQRNSYVSMDREQGHPGVGMADLPSGIVSAPLTWKYLKTSLRMVLGAGMVGATQNRTTGALRAVHGWWVAHAVSQFIHVESSEDECSVRVEASARLKTLAGVLGLAPRARRISLHVEGPELLELEGLTLRDDVRILTLRGCDQLGSLRGLERLRSIEELNIEQARVLDDVDAIEQLRLLQRVTIVGCPALPDWAQGDFEGEALRDFLARLGSQETNL